jgi:type IV pilus assembly protein PilB
MEDPEISKEKLVDTGMSSEEAAGCTPYKGSGCDNCADTGFRGRVAVYEVMVMTDTLKEYVLNGASAAEIKQEAIRGGLSTLRRSILNKVLEGTTTIEEVYRVSTSDS